MNMNRQNSRCVTQTGVSFGCRQGCQPCDGGTVSGVVGCVSGCGDGCNMENVLQGMPVAMAYVPWQSFGNLYPVPQALRNGTLFQELNLDFMGRRCN